MLWVLIGTVEEAFIQRDTFCKPFFHLGQLQHAAIAGSNTIFIKTSYTELVTCGSDFHSASALTGSFNAFIAYSIEKKSRRVQ